MMPTSRIGSRLTIGAGSLMPNSDAAKPSWKTATIAPRAAVIDSRNPAIALSGTSSDRNAIASSTNARPTMTAR